MAGFTPFKYASIKDTCTDIISTETKEKEEDEDFIKKRNRLAMDIINGELIYLKYKDEDNQKEAAGDDDDEDLTAAISRLDINKKASGGKRKTKRKNKKSKKSSRKKRKHRKTRKSKK